MHLFNRKSLGIRKKYKIGCLTILLIFALSLGILAILNWYEANQRNKIFDLPYLTKAEKNQITESLRLKNILGNKVWPEFGETHIPIIIFNDKYEFLIELTEVPPPWEKVSKDNYEGAAYYRRYAKKSTYFAVSIGEHWAGSLGTLERMNKEFLFGVREQLPPVLAQLFPYPMATLKNDLHIVLLLHEMFHAFQAIKSPSHFSQAQTVYSLEETYPYDDKEFSSLWKQEGSALSSALKAEDESEARDLIKQFLQIRDTRRKKAKLDEKLLEYELELEWLEGLPKYVEIRFYELAASANESEFYAYRPGLPYWKMEFYRLNHLGRLDGDYRFYLSGMAQARLLDRLMPNWKKQVVSDLVCMEDLLRIAVQSN